MRLFQKYTGHYTYQTAKGSDDNFPNRLSYLRMSNQKKSGDIKGKNHREFKTNKRKQTFKKTEIIQEAENGIKIVIDGHIE